MRKFFAFISRFVEEWGDQRGTGTTPFWIRNALIPNSDVARRPTHRHQRRNGGREGDDDDEEETMLLDLGYGISDLQTGSHSLLQKSQLGFSSRSLHSSHQPPPLYFLSLPLRFPNPRTQVSVFESWFERTFFAFALQWPRVTGWSNPQFLPMQVSTEIPNQSHSNYSFNLNRTSIWFVFDCFTGSMYHGSPLLLSILGPLTVQR